MPSRWSLTKTIVAIVNQPKIAGVTINTTPARPGGADSVVPALSVSVQNPLARPVRGKLIANIADGRLRGEAELIVPPRAFASAVVTLSAVPADFPFNGFDWRVTFESDAGRGQPLNKIGTLREPHVPIVIAVDNEHGRLPAADGRDW